jgi:TIR domain-containing protein
MPKSKRTPNTFLCYAHSDRITVHHLYTRLLENGIKVWLDSENLQPGQDWQYEIRRVILKCDVVLVCLSREFNKQHGYRYEELKIALEKAKLLEEERIFVIPIRLEKCAMPDSLAHLHRVDLFATGGYEKLLSTLKNLRGSP